MKKKKIKNGSFTAYNEYMSMARRIAETMEFGDQEKFLNDYNASQKPEEKISRTTLVNALQGFYMQKGIQVMYKRVDILDALSAWLLNRRAAEQAQKESLAEKVSAL